MNNNLLIIKHEELLSEWDYARNEHAHIDVNNITCGSGRKVWWKCSAYGHSYEMPVYRRTGNEKRGCPYCSGQKVLPGFNDLQTLYPDIASEWYQPLNGEIMPSMITKGNMHITIHDNNNAHITTPSWKCKTCGFIWHATVHDRTSNKSGCPACAGKQVLPGVNDLVTLHQDLMKEWDWQHNDDMHIKPYEITAGSKIKAWWKCKTCGFEWMARIDRRTSKNNSGCPKCSHRISKQENQVADYMNYYLHNHYAYMNYKMERSIKFKTVYNILNINIDDVLTEGLESHLMKELDIYIPELKLAVEYDGDYWHSDEIVMKTRGITNDEAHKIKQSLCEHADITLLIISEHEWLHDNEHVKNMITNVIMNACNERYYMNN